MHVLSRWWCYAEICPPWSEFHGVCVRLSGSITADGQRPPASRHYVTDQIKRNAVWPVELNAIFNPFFKINNFTLSSFVPQTDPFMIRSRKEISNPAEVDS